MPLILGTNSIKDTGYEVANSLRFDDGSSDDLTLTGQSATNNKKFTFSSWIKRGVLGSKAIMSWEKSSDSSYNFRIAFRSDDVLQILDYAGGVVMDYRTNQVFRDVSAWYNIVVAVDTTDATANDRTKLFVNGERITSFGTQTTYSLNDSTQAQQSGYFCAIGSINSGTYFDGYQTETTFIDGTDLNETLFGEFDSDSPTIWKPINVSGLTFGNNGFYLDFENSGSLGADVSGNGNNFTVNNLTSIDQSTDTCTNNFATLNPLHNGGTLSEGNLKFVGTSQSVNGTFGLSAGKWYFEVKSLSSSTGYLGFADSTWFGTDVSWTYSQVYVYISNGNKGGNGSATSYGNTYTTNDIIGVALDMDSGSLTFYKNGVSEGVAFNTGISGKTLFPFLTSSVGGYTYSVNFGNPAFTISSGNSDGNGHGNFEYAVPSGYYALNTKNLSEYG